MNLHKNEHFVTLDSEQPEDNPQLVLNLQKGFTFSERLKIGIGTRSATAPSWEKVALADFFYANTQLQ